MRGEHIPLLLKNRIAIIMESATLSKISARMLHVREISVNMEGSIPNIRRPIS